MPKLALVQQGMSDRMEDNVKKSLFLLNDAAQHGAEVVLFPEVQFSPFFPQYRDGDASSYLMDTQHGVVRQFQEACGERGVVAFLNFYLREKGNTFDASLVIDSKGEIAGLSKMVHIVQAAKFYEQSYYTPSDGGFQVFRTAYGNIGVVICFDRHFPESIRSCALQGAQLIVIPTANIREEPLDLFEWEVRIPAFQNCVYIAMCNRVGVEGNMDFCGQSIVADPNGNVIAKAGDQEQVLYADYDLSFPGATAERRPYLKLRRPEAYMPEGSIQASQDHLLSCRRESRRPEQGIGKGQS